MIRFQNIHYTRCMQKHLALTQPGGHWPLDGSTWTAGTPAAWEQLKSMAQVYVTDVRRTDPRDPRRIWQEDEARALLIHLCEAILDASEMYPDNRWCHVLLAEVNPT